MNDHETIPTLTGHEIVDRVAELRRKANFDVDVIPPSWDIEMRFTKKSGQEQIDFEAQRILAWILSWYAPARNAPWKRRFEGKNIRISWPMIQRRFLLSDYKVEIVLNRLRDDYGLIKRISGPNTRTSTKRTAGGKKQGAGGYLYVEPVMRRVEEITYPAVIPDLSPETGGAVEPWSHGGGVFGGPYYVNTEVLRGAGDQGSRLLLHSEDDGLVSVLTLGAPGGGAGSVDDREGRGPVTSAEAPLGRRGTTGPPHPPGLIEGEEHPIDPAVEECDFLWEVSRRDIAEMEPWEQEWLVPDLKRLDAETRTMATALAVRFRKTLRSVRRRNRNEVVRWAWRCSFRLVSGDLVEHKHTAPSEDRPHGTVESRPVRNALDRLARRVAEPHAVLVEIAALAAGRIVGNRSERRQAALDLLSCVGTDRPFVGIDPEMVPRPDFLESVLERAHRRLLYEGNLAARIREVCPSDQEDAERKARVGLFTKVLLGAVADPWFQFDAGPFAAALARASNTPGVPSVEGFLDALLGRLKPHQVGVGRARVLVGTEGDGGELVAHPSVVELGQGKAYSYTGPEGEVYTKVDDVEAGDDGETEIVGEDGSRLKASDAVVNHDPGGTLRKLARRADFS